MKKLKCVLLVDDDTAFNYLHRRTIKKFDLAETIQEVLNAREALDYLTNQGAFVNNGTRYPQPDLIFLDINMPGMSGWDFLEEYKKLPAEQKGKIVLVMLTTSLNPEDEERARKNPEISDFIHKPLSMEALEEVIQQYFRD
jgi:CheY-like chemotaxis protein